MVEEHGVFIEIYVATPVEECERRDTKGNYKKARAGKIKDFTGVNDPYEVPEHPELTFNTMGHTPEVIVEAIVEYLRERNLL